MPESTNILRCKCARCGKKGIYSMSSEEMALKAKYMEKGREMGSLRDIFPNIPEWILYGALDPMVGDNCICPSCQKK